MPGLLGTCGRIIIRYAFCLSHCRGNPIRAQYRELLLCTGMARISEEIPHESARVCQCPAGLDDGNTSKLRLPPMYFSLRSIQQRWSWALTPLSLTCLRGPSLGIRQGLLHTVGKSLADMDLKLLRSLLQGPRASTCQASGSSGSRLGSTASAPSPEIDSAGCCKLLSERAYYHDNDPIGQLIEELCEVEPDYRVAPQTSTAL